MDRRFNVRDLQQKVDAGGKLVMVAVSDRTQATLADEAGVDMLLVDDSLAHFALGLESGVSVTLEQIIYHTAAVVRGSRHALVAAGLPFGAYQHNDDMAVDAALRLLKESGCGAVMLEGGRELTPLVTRLTKVGVPIVAHIGLTPQTAALWDDAPARGMDESTAWELVDAAQELEEAGAFLILMKCVAAEAATLISTKVDVPTVGAGCGSGCDGQVLSFPDLLGLNDETPWYAQSFIAGGQLLRDGLSAYATAVRDGSFPQPQNACPMEEDEAKKLY